MSRPDHPLSFAMADGVLRRIGVPAGFDLHKNKRGALPGDYIDFAVLGTVAGGHDPVTERPDVINGQDLGSAAECQKAMEKKRKRQGPYSLVINQFSILILKAPSPRGRRLGTPRNR